jgi:S1-C subfamily serine protease
LDVKVGGIAAVARSSRVARPAAATGSPRYYHHRGAKIVCRGVACRSPGAAAGIGHGDLLTHLGGQPVVSSTGLALLLDGLAAGDSVAATVVRGNDELSVAIRLP